MSREQRRGRAPILVWLAVLLCLTPLLAGCDLSSNVVVVTPTPGKGQALPSPEVTIALIPAQVQATALPTAAPPSTADLQGTLAAAVAQTMAAMPSDTPVPPTDTPVPPTPDLDATVRAAVALTQAAAPSATAVPPSKTPKPTARATTRPVAPLSSYKIVYGEFAGGSQGDENKYSIWMMRGDGSEANRVVERGFEPALSPAGNKIAYYRCFSGINVYDTNTKQSTVVWSNPYAEFPSFSPDGGRIVYHEWVGDWYSMNVSLYIINVDGTGKIKLPIEGIRPAWSPRGDLISYDSCSGTSCGMFVIQPDGGGRRQVTTDTGAKGNWSPDGNKLVYGADVGADPEIFSVNVDGSGRKQLTDNSGNDTLPVYAPDGQWIFWLSDQNHTAWAIMAMRSDGSDVRPIRGIGVPERWQFSRLWVGWW